MSWLYLHLSVSFLVLGLLMYAFIELSRSPMYIVPSTAIATEESEASAPRGLQSFVAMVSASTEQKLQPMPKKMVLPSLLSDGEDLSLSKPFQILTCTSPLVGSVFGAPDANSGPRLGLCPVWQRSWRYIDQGPLASCAAAGPASVSNSAPADSSKAAPL